MKRSNWIMFFNISGFIFSIASFYKSNGLQCLIIAILIANNIYLMLKK
ncbi:MAG: hypothetical protein ABFD08_09645 [Syntrophomonas sp.]